ncbi:DUF1697 domain-containing protein [Pseudoalteromonas denitrificans]|uniref:Uncharacterized conserved protein, DUF1697 family n=1 Tax=Pseudoalteromonas denitrificans DSM 6059 TaxID=1123010 RepID=A0A1I1LL35_9GAMM|nr:DUF1697 domain-containing protein [Pseudoalteromonas denitrificans]SFC71688.1 Uncharacterized conserved protein, DUF1697 family [Pseudoalteromonas denitrificans DSM 6059]
MKSYTAILRGINVAGQKKVKMTDLKTLYESMGFKNVVTYIQSGNIIFDSDIDEIENIKTQIETGINHKYDFEVPVDVRTSAEFACILDVMPFDDIDLDVDGTKVLITFLSEQPSKSKKQALQEYAKAPERLLFGDQCIYLHCPNGYGKTKLSNVFIENKLGMIATTRNLKSVTKLVELSKN